MRLVLHIFQNPRQIIRPAHIVRQDKTLCKRNKLKLQSTPVYAQAGSLGFAYLKSFPPLHIFFQIWDFSTLCCFLSPVTTSEIIKYKSGLYETEKNLTRFLCVQLIVCHQDESPGVKETFFNVHTKSNNMKTD